MLYLNILYVMYYYIYQVIYLLILLLIYLTIYFMIFIQMMKMKTKLILIVVYGHQAEGYNNVFVSQTDGCDHYCACYGQHLFTSLEKL